MTSPEQRIVLLVRHRGNRARLRDWAEQSLRAEVVRRPEEADLIVADPAAFVTEREAIDGARELVAPVFLPLLLICTAREANRMGADMWRSVDDVVVAPIRPDELRVRVERLIGRRATSLAAESSRAELQRSNVDLERFAFVAAHELVAPLSAVAGAVQTLAARFVDGDPAALEVADVATEGCRRMDGLISDILDLSRVGRGVADGTVSIQEIVDEVCRDLRRQLDEVAAAVRYDGLPSVVGSAAHLRLVFRNLVANALKFRRERVAPLIEIEAVREGDAWKFSVTDNGVGVDDREREAVFGLFSRSASSAVPGAGIGLAICRRVIEHAGGRIWIEKREAEGTRFCFTLPAPAGR